MGFVFFAFFDGAFVQIEVFVGSEALADLFFEIAVGHRVSYGNNFEAKGFERFNNGTGGLRFAATGSDGADRNNRFTAFDRSLMVAKQFKSGANGGYLAGTVHDIFMRHVRIRKNHFLNVVLFDEVEKFFFGFYRDSLGVALASEFGGVNAAFDVGNLGSSESDNFIGRVLR